MTLIFADMVSMLYLETINNLFTNFLAIFYKNHTLQEWCWLQAEKILHQQSEKYFLTKPETIFKLPSQVKRLTKFSP